jgi:hypothetical protein
MAANSYKTGTGDYISPMKRRRFKMNEARDEWLP